MDARARGGGGAFTLRWGRLALGAGVTEADLVERMSDFLHLYLQGIAVTFSVVTAYVAALHYFLRAAPFSARVFVFIFMTGILGALGLHVFVAHRLFIALTAGLDALKIREALSPAGLGVWAIAMNGATQIHIWSVWGFGVAAYLGLLMMTFVFNWRYVRRSGDGLAEGGER